MSGRWYGIYGACPVETGGVDADINMDVKGDAPVDVGDGRTMSYYVSKEALSST